MDREVKQLKTESLAHLRNLSSRAGFDTLNDWYIKPRNITAMQPFNQYLSEVINGDLLGYLEAQFPGQAIEWWRMARAPRGTWEQHKRLKEYMNWLFNQLGYQRVTDWYGVRAKDFNNNFGGSVQVYYPSIIDRLEICYPDSEWLPWLFEEAPNGCWTNKKNHKKFLDYVAAKEGWTQPEDWYKATRSLFTKYKGAGLLKFYENIFDCISNNYPDYGLKFWLMRKSRGNWADKANQRNYLDWLGEKMCFGRAL